MRAVGTRPVRFFVASTNSATCGTPGWFQYHSNTQVPMRASGGRPSSGSISCCAPARWSLLVEAELHRLLQRVEHVVAREQEEDDVGVRRLRLDEIGREVDGAERGEIAADSRAAERGRPP